MMQSNSHPYIIVTASALRYLDQNIGIFDLPSRLRWKGKFRNDVQFELGFGHVIDMKYLYTFLLNSYLYK